MNSSVSPSFAQNSAKLNFRRNHSLQFGSSQVYLDWITTDFELIGSGHPLIKFLAEFLSVYLGALLVKCRCFE